MKLKTEKCSRNGPRVRVCEQSIYVDDWTSCRSIQALIQAFPVYIFWMKKSESILTGPGCPVRALHELQRL